MTAKGVSRLADAWSKAQQAYDRGQISDQEWKYIFSVQRMAERSRPHELWEVILGVLDLKPGAEVKGILAAGPLEDLIRDYGAEMLPAIEARVASDADFAELIRGVWVRSSDDAVTRRYLELGCDQVAV